MRLNDELFRFEYKRQSLKRRFGEWKLYKTYGK